MKRNFINLLLFTLFVCTAPLASAAVCPDDTCRDARWNAWINTAFAEQTAIFTYTLAVTPDRTNQETIVGLSNNSQTATSGLAAAVRFNAGGTIDVRDGTTWRTLAAYPYTDRTTYVLRLVLDIPRHVYSVYVRRDGQPETLLAYNFAFQAGHQSATRLNNVALWAGTQLSRICASAPEPWQIATPAAVWKNKALRSEIHLTYGGGDFVFEARSQASGSDSLVALTPDPQFFWTRLPIIVRFNVNNTVDVRDGDVYRANAVFAYQPHKTYTVRITVYGDPAEDAGVPGRTYSVWINELGQPPVQIASYYRFRTEMSNPILLNNWVVQANPGGLAANLISAPARP